MIRKKFYLAVIALFFFNNVLAASVNKGKPAHSKRQWLTKQIKTQKKVIADTIKQINDLEQNLNVGNKRYLRTIKKRKLIETRVYEMTKKSENLDLLLNKKLKEISKSVRGILVNSMGEQGTPSELLTRKILIQKLTESKKSYRALIQENNMIAGKLKSLTDRLTEYRNIEHELTSVLQNLEYQKRDKTTRYYSTLKSKDDMESKLSRIKINKTVNKAKASIRRGIFRSPMADFISLDYKKKGVTYKYKGKRPITSAGKGKVVYKGTLSNFGNVIMVDHGNQTRTVLLGNFESKIEKGMLVQPGQLLGYTRETGVKQDKLYFEVRKKNKVQNTIHFIDRNSLAKNQQSNDNT